jgi:hypothetical protein
MKVIEIMLHPSAAQLLTTNNLIYQDPEYYDFSMDGVYIELKDKTQLHFNIHHVVGVVVRELEEEE